MIGMTKPNIANLRKRAKALGLAITKVNAKSPLDGLAEYVVHHPGQDWTRQKIVTIHGVAAHIKQCESVREAVE